MASRHYIPHPLFCCPPTSHLMLMLPNRFSQLPHYHAQEATEYIKREIGSLYLKDDTPIAVALWRSFLDCQYVDKCVSTDGKPIDAVLWYKSWYNSKP